MNFKIRLITTRTCKLFLLIFYLSTFFINTVMAGEILIYDCTDDNVFNKGCYSSDGYFRYVDDW